MFFYLRVTSFKSRLHKDPTISHLISFEQLDGLLINQMHIALKLNKAAGPSGLDAATRNTCVIHLYPFLMNQLLPLVEDFVWHVDLIGMSFNCWRSDTIYLVKQFYQSLNPTLWMLLATCNYMLVKSLVARLLFIIRRFFSLKIQRHYYLYVAVSNAFNSLKCLSCSLKYSDFMSVLGRVFVNAYHSDMKLLLMSRPSSTTREPHRGPFDHGYVCYWYTLVKNIVITSEFRQI